MKIGIITPSFLPKIGGVEKHVYKIGKELVKEKNEVIVVARFVRLSNNSKWGWLINSEKPRYYEQEGMRVSVLSTGFIGKILLKVIICFYNRITECIAIILFSAIFYNSIKTYLKHCDILHFSRTGGELLGYCALKLARKKNMPLVITPHMHIGASGDYKIDYRLYRQADAVIALTKTEKEHMVKKGVPAERISVIGNGIDLEITGNKEDFIRKNKIKNPFVLFAGRKTKDKGYYLLLKAARSVLNKRNDIDFVFVGPLEKPFSYHYSKEIRDILKHPNIHEMGALPEKDKEDAFAACDVFCLPSIGESFGLVYFEAWKYKKPIIALKLPVLEELIGEAKGGLLTEEESEDIANAIIKLVDNKELREDLGNNGYERARQQDSWKDVADKVESVYESVLSKKIFKG